MFCLRESIPTAGWPGLRREKIRAKRPIVDFHVFSDREYSANFYTLPYLSAKPVLIHANHFSDYIQAGVDR